MRESWVDDYLRSVSRRFSPGTLKGYSWALLDWEKFLGYARAADGRGWTPLDIEEWQESLAARHLSPYSRQLASCAMRGMLKWLARHDRPVRANLWLAVDGVKTPRRLPRPIPNEHLRRLLAYFRPRRRGAPVTHWRDRALFFCLLTTGARVSEALQLTVDDVGGAAMVTQKGGSSKVLFLPQFAQEAVADYLRYRNDNHPALWVTRGTPEHPVRRLSSDAVRDIWHRTCEVVGIPRFTTHQLRHSCGSYLEQVGIPIEVIADVLGHASLASTKGYVQIGIGRRQLAIDAMQQLAAGEQRLPPNVAGVAFKAGRRRTRLIGGS